MQILVALFDTLEIIDNLVRHIEVSKYNNQSITHYKYNQKHTFQDQHLFNLNTGPFYRLLFDFQFISNIINIQMIELSIQHSHHHEHDGHNHKEKKITQQEEEEDEQENWDQMPCHPHRHVEAFDFSKIQLKIKQIRQKKEAAKRAAQSLKKVPKSKKEFYESDVIQQVLQQSRDLVPIHISQALQHRIKFIEEKVYIGLQNDTYGGLIQRIKQEVLVNQALGNQLNLVMNQVQVHIQSDIIEGSYEIHKVQHKPKHPPPEPEPSHRVKLKNMLIRSKIRDLKEEFLESQLSSDHIIRSQNASTSRVSKKDNHSYIEKKQGEIWGDEFHLLSEGTKKAQHFIKKINHDQKKIREAKHSKIQELQSLQVKSAMQHKQFQEQIKKQKHESIRKRYEESRLDKKVEKQKKEKMEQDYNIFLKEYNAKVPLYKKKQKEYIKKVIQEQQIKRKMKLSEIHQSKKPMTHEELISHMKKYQKIKEEKETSILVQKEMKRKEILSLPKKNYFRGRYHSIIQERQAEEKNKADPTIIRDELLKKQRQFGEIIRKKYAPMISQLKKTQLEEMMKKLQGQQKNVKALSQDQYKRLGNEYLKQIKNMIKQLRQKGLLKKPQQQQQKVRAKDYLREVRDKYNLSSIDYNSQVQSNSEWVHNKAMKHEQDAKIKQKVIRYRDDDLDIERYMEELKEINDNYINSAEAKICLIKKLEGDKLDRSQVLGMNRSKNTEQQQSEISINY